MLRKLLPVLFLALAGALPMVGAAAPESPLAWVEARYVSVLADFVSGARVAESDFLSAFTPQMQAVWREARKGPGPKMAGPILNVYFGWGVLPGRDVVLEGFALDSDDGDEARVRVDLRVQGAPRRTYVDVKRISGAWRIEDIAYSQGDSFQTYERKCAAGAC